MAPRSSRRAPEGVRASLEVAIFELATAALVASTGAGRGPKITFAVVAARNALLDHALARTRPACPPQGLTMGKPPPHPHVSIQPEHPPAGSPRCRDGTS